MILKRAKGKIESCCVRLVGLNTLELDISLGVTLEQTRYITTNSSRS